MWQAPNQRLRSVIQAKKREREKKRRPVHLKRVSAEIRPLATKLGQAAAVTAARVLLNDITVKGLGIFSEHAMTPGQSISITLEEPRRFYVKGRVVWCQEFEGESRVLSAQRYSYRVGIQFVFQSAEEQAEVEKFLTELSEQHVHGDGFDEAA
jgi:hypothetical protein